MTASPSVALRDLPSLLRQADGWAGLRAALAADQSGTIDGTWGSSASLAVAALALEKPPAVLVVLPHVSDLSAWAEDIASFLGTKPDLFPAWETWPPPTIHGRLVPETAQRLRLLQKLIA